MKIVIVGGGTAGWISAAFILKETIGYEVTVVESNTIPIIGAGEGSTGSLPWLLQQPGWEENGKAFNEMDFLRKTKGTLKMGIRFQNWKGDGSHIYSPLNSTPTHKVPIDSTFFASILKNGRSDASSVHYKLMEDSHTVWGKDKTNKLMTGGSYAFHFDGHSVGNYFKEYCIKKGVKIIHSEIDDLKFDENEYLKSALLQNGQTIEGDLWFDCTGFARVLMSKTKNKWISFKENLPANSAIPFSDTISSRTYKPFTEANAMDAGWMWKIPLQQRLGCGYVSCDDFQSFDKSVEEIEKTVGHKIEPIKHIKFEAGRYEGIWYKNIIANGLASHFLEPLQATSIHMSIFTITNLVWFFLKSPESVYSTGCRDSFNRMTNIMIDDYRDMIQMHYLSGRNDTPFWKSIKNEIVVTDKNKELFDIAKHRCLGMLDFDSRHGTAGWPVWSHILDMAGMFDNKTMIETELRRYGRYQQGLDWLQRQSADYKRLKPELMSAEEFFKYIKI
jgi:tryptophan halogenase